MGWRLSKITVGVFLSAIISNSSVKAAPELNVERHEINGYSVFLIDSPVGNAVRIESFVPRGGFHDARRLDGVSHYFEHVIHSGSERYPRREEFNEITTENGAATNASTGQGMTRYYMHFHPEAYDVLIDLFGDMMTHPTFPTEELEREKAAVIQEITDYSQRASMSAFFASFVYLLPEDHFLRKFITIGVPDTVSAVSRDDILDIFLTDYRPENIKVVVAANFSGGEITKEQALAGVQRAFRPNAIFENPVPSHMTPAHAHEFAPLVQSPDQARLIELGTKDSSRTLSVMFDFPRNEEVNELALEVLFDYLNLRNEGSLADVLLKRGWITSQGAGDLDANDMKLMYLQWQLTEEGASHRDEMIEMLFSELHRIKTKGLRDDELAFLKEMNISSYRESFQGRSGAVDFFKRFSIKGVDANEIFDLEKRYGSVTAAEVSRMASLPSPTNMFVSQMDPSFTGEESRTFHRPYRISPLPATSMEAWQEADQQGNKDHPCQGIETGQIPLEFASESFAEEQGRKTMTDSELGSQLFLLEEQGTRQGSLSAHLHTGRFSEDVQTGLSLSLSAFSERYAAEITYLRNIGILRSIDLDYGRLSLSFKGDSLANQQAYRWLLEKIVNFEATPEELARSLEKLEVAAQHEEDRFTAQVANTYSIAALSPKSTTSASHYRIASAEGFLSRAPELSKKFFSSITLQLAMVGDYRLEQLSDLEAVTAETLPAGLSDFDPHLPQLPINAQVDYWRASSENKKDGDYGASMMVAGPPVLSTDEAAMMIIKEVLHDEVFRINRTEGELGYVHGYGVVTGREWSNLLFYGGTSSEADFQKMQTGWKEALVAAREKLTPKVFEATRRAVLLKRRIIPGSPSDRADRITSGFFTYGDPESFERRTTAVQSLTYEDTMAAFDRYLRLDAGYFFTEVSKKPSCVKALQEASAVRAALKK